MSRFKFLNKYAEDGRHYDLDTEVVRGMNSPNAWDRRAVSKIRNLKPDHLEIMSRDPDHVVVGQAAMHPNATEDQLERAINHPHWFVKACAINNPKIQAHHLQKLINDDDPDVKWEAGERLKQLNGISESRQSELLFNRPDYQSDVKEISSIIADLHNTLPRRSGTSKVMHTHDVRNTNFAIRPVVDRAVSQGYTASYVSGSLAKLRNKETGGEVFVHHHPANGQPGFVDVRTDVPDNLRSIIR